MVGLIEGAVIGGKLLAPHAGKVAGQLVGKATYRIRVDWRVRRQTHIQYPRRAFRRWLKEFGRADLSTPIEAAAPRLATELDAWLDENDDGWGAVSGRLSRALVLVEATYFAILAIEEPGRARQLIEHWARYRNEDIVNRLAELAGGYAGGLSAEDMALWLQRRSHERRRVRLSPFALRLDQVEEHIELTRRQIPPVPSGSVRILTGAFGMGKSEIAEEWHRSAVTAFPSNDGTPVPVWLHARSVPDAGLEHALTSVVGPALLTRRGVALVIDGLDEIGEWAAADALARDARVFVAGNHQSSVLITTRPGMFERDPDAITVSGLSTEDARRLVERIAGQNHATWRWSNELLETIRSPFFAIAAGSLLATGEAPSGEADVIRRLVERALRRGTSESVTGTHEVFEILVRLGVSLTRSSGRDDGLTFREREVVRSTRLTADGANRIVSFALPIFEQWFAAQGLLEQAELEAEAFASPGAFSRWRWALAVAVLDARVDRADQLIEACLQFNPGAGAWLVEQVSQPMRWREPQDDDLDARVAKARILRATRTWINALGPAAPRFFPMEAPTELVQLGIRVSGRSITRAWSRRQPTADDVVDLPPTIHPLNRAGDAEWLAAWSGPVPRGQQWPWTMVRDDIARNSLRMLEGQGLLGPIGGVWHRERMYRAARIILGARGLRFEPIARPDVLDAASRLLSEATRWGDPKRTIFQIGRTEVPGRDLADLLDWLRREESEVLERPVPVPDEPHPRGGWVWNLYTPDHLVRYCAEVLGLACEVYDEMADVVLTQFAWSLGMNACRPFGVVGTVMYPQPGKVLGDAPGLAYTELPMSLVEDKIRAQPGMCVASNGRAAVRLSTELDGTDRYTEWLEYAATLRRWVADVGIDSPFWHLNSGDTVIHPVHERPVSLQAAQWIWDDLKRLSLGTGTFPQLEQ